jgi:hypothetical protein
MIHHISIAAKDPRHVAEVLAELWQTRAFPFPPVEGGYIVISDDGRGTAIEVTPLGAEIIPGEGDDPAQTTQNAGASPYTATHAALSVPLSRGQVREIAEREGWQTGEFVRGGVFEVIELWVEGRLLLELLAPDMAQRYLDCMTTSNYAAMLEAARDRLAA